MVSTSNILPRVFPARAFQSIHSEESHWDVGREVTSSTAPFWVVGTGEAETTEWIEKVKVKKETRVVPIRMVQCVWCGYGMK